MTEEALSLESRHKPNAAISTYNLGSHNLHAGNLEQAREWLERAVALTLDLGFKEVMAYALASYVQLCLLDGDAARAAHLAGVADRLAHGRRAPAPTRGAGAVRGGEGDGGGELGDAYAAAHDAAMAAPLEEALREGGVLAEAPASP